MKIATWNINGLRSGWGKFYDFLKSENPDIVCLQEIKVDDAKLPNEYREPLGYKSYWFHAEKPGYSGVAIYSKIKPKNIEQGIGENEFDREGRVLTIEFDKFSISNWYFPHSGRSLERLNFKLRFNQEYAHFGRSLPAMLSRKALQAGSKMRQIIFCGDYNVAHEEIDIARPKDNVKNAGFTPEEREWMDKFLEEGYIDAYRFKNPGKKEYTWWSNRRGVRERNVGWRIDYFLVPRHMEKSIKKCRIETGIYGSDHCPVVLEINL